MKKSEPLISIIVPVYKVEKYIEKCLQSIINQTYKNLQIIIVDDGSPDNCARICDEFALKDNRIEVIHRENRGLSEARNFGLTKAKGEYIGFVDSDDYIENTMYEDMLNLIEKENADVCICNFYNVIDGKNIIKNSIKENCIYDKTQILKEVLLDRNIQSYAWNKLYKKDLFNDVKYPVGKKYEDIGTTFYLLEQCKKVIVTSKPEYYYLNREDSIVNQNCEQTIMDYVEIVEQRYDYIEKNYKELQKYNIYYLVNILATAYSDMCFISNVSENLITKLNELYEKTKKIVNENHSEIIDILNEKQRMQLYTLLYDKDLYMDMVRKINKI